MAFLSNFDNGVENPQELTLVISAEAAASGTVQVPGIGFSQNFTVPAGGLTTVIVPNGAVAGTGGAIATEPLGIHVTSNTEVSVYGLNDMLETTDGFLGLPVATLGTQYRVLTYNDPTFSEIGVVATANGTVVTVVPSAALIGGTPAGTPVVRTLNAGDVLFLPSIAAGDLTGSTVTASQPVAVFGAASCALIPTNGFACNHLVEQLPPTSAWGSDFITVPLASRVGGDRVRVLANQAGTTVSFNGTVVATLGAGQFHEQVVTATTHIVSSSPVLVGYYSQGASVDLGTGDPSMMLIPPTSQFLPSYTFNSSDNFAPNFVNVVAPTASLGSLTLDGAAVNPAAFTAVPGTAFSVAQLSLSPGAHRLVGSADFGAYVYGFAQANAYSFPAGGDVPEQAGVATLTLAPPTQTQTIGLQACVDATLLDAQGQPQAGAPIAFTVTGANTASGTVNTGINGVAQFCYAGTNAGTDTVTATSGTLQATATVTWTAAGVATLTLAPPTQAQTIGLQACVDATLLDAQGQPQAGVAIAFTVTGANTASGTVNTGSNGVAQFCYAGANVGTDTVTASSGTLQATATVVWSSAQGNKPPVVKAGRDQKGIEGKPVQLYGFAFDTDPLTTTWTATPGPGVDAGASCVFADASALITTVTCNDDGHWIITLTASDGINPPVSDSLKLKLANADPKVKITSPADKAVVERGATVSVSATVQDPGSNDTLSCKIDWGDGKSSIGTLANGVCTGQHVYGALGTYRLVVRATDDDRGSDSDSVKVVVKKVAEPHKLYGKGTINRRFPWWHTVSFSFFASSGQGQLNGELTVYAGKDRFEGLTVTSLSVDRSDATWSGTGHWNGKSGYTFTAEIEDDRKSGHERHGRDKESFEIKVRDRHGKTVFEASGPLTSGFVSID